MHCTDIRKLRFIIRKTSSRRAPVHPRPRDGKRLRATSPAWCQCSSCSTFVGVSDDGMQEPPNESDASVSTLIIVLETMLFTRCLLHLPVLFIYTVLDTDIGSKYTDKSVKKY